MKSGCFVHKVSEFASGSRADYVGLNGADFQMPLKKGSKAGFVDGEGTNFSGSNGSDAGVESRMVLQDHHARHCLKNRIRTEKRSK